MDLITISCLAFFYRKRGKFDAALDNINKSLQYRPKFSKAKREKVQVLIGMQNYNEALELAKENYENYKDNPYHIHAYYSCLIKSDDPTPEKEKLQALLNDMSEIDSNLAREMVARMRAQYTAIIDENYEKAMFLIDEAIKMPGNNIYGRMVKFEIAERFRKIEDMREVIQFFYLDEYRHRFHDNIVCMNSIIEAMAGSIDEAEKYFQENIRYYTKEAQDHMLQKLRKFVK